MKVSPMNWRPALPDDLVGRARVVCMAQIAKARRLRADRSGSYKLLLIGAPGIGKTTVAELIAAELTGSKMSVQDYNGKEVTVDLVKEWMAALPYGDLFSTWSVKIVNELDRCSRDAQDLMLSYLDKLPPGKAFIGTSNLQLDLLTERFQTRFQSVKLIAPETEELADLMIRRWRTPKQTALQIAVGSGGCVRAALADLESWLDAKEGMLV